MQDNSIIVEDCPKRDLWNNEEYEAIIQIDTDKEQL